MRRATALFTTGATAVALLTAWQSGSGPRSLGGVHVVAAPPAATAPRPTSKRAAHKSAAAAGVPQSTSAPRHIAGALVSTPYGNVQVSATVVGHRLTDVRPLQLTDAGSTSVSISAAAVPILHQEALTAQSANIDAVSGATYTSEGYKQSLQSALDQAHL